MHAAALPQIISNNIGKFSEIRKIFRFIRKIHIGSWLECNDIPGNSNAGPTTCMLREDKESIILFLLNKLLYKTGFSTCLLEFFRLQRS
jgi:hypothetical protein